MAGEKKRGGRWRAEQIEMRGILFFFDCLPGVILSFPFFYFFFSRLPIVYRIGPGPLRRIVPPKLLVVDFTSFH